MIFSFISIDYFNKDVNWLQTVLLYPQMRSKGFLISVKLLLFLQILVVVKLSRPQFWSITLILNFVWSLSLMACFFSWPLSLTLFDLLVILSWVVLILSLTLPLKGLLKILFIVLNYAHVSLIRYTIILLFLILILHQKLFRFYYKIK
jgi:hypothetical protein